MTGSNIINGIGGRRRAWRRSVAGRDVGHDVVHLGEDETAAWRKNVQPFADIIPDLPGGTVGQYVLGVAAAAPEGEIAAEFPASTSGDPCPRHWSARG